MDRFLVNRGAALIAALLLLASTAPVIADYTIHNIVTRKFNGGATAMVASPANSNIVYVGNAVGSVHTLDVRNGRIGNVVLDKFNGGAQSLAVHPHDPNILYVGNGAGSVHTLDVRNGRIGNVAIGAFNGGATALAVSKLDSNILFVGNGAGSVHTLDVQTGRIGNVAIGKFNRGAQSLAVDPRNPRRLFVGNGVGSIHTLGIFSQAIGDVVIQRYGGGATGLTIRESEPRFLYVGARDGSVQRIDLDCPNISYKNLLQLVERCTPWKQTKIFLNFDGFNQSYRYALNGGEFHYERFNMSPERRLSDEDRQQILYHLSEFYKLFNVEVGILTSVEIPSVLKDGNTVVHVGLVNRSPQTFSSGTTPLLFADHPRPNIVINDPRSQVWLKHRINSNNFDISVVAVDVNDPMPTKEKPYWIASIAAHEAGHTLGFPHTRPTRTGSNSQQPRNLMVPGSTGVSRGWMTFKNEELQFVGFGDPDEAYAIEYSVGVAKISFGSVNPQAYLYEALPPPARHRDAIQDAVNLASIGLVPGQNGNYPRLRPGGRALNGPDQIIDWRSDYDAYVLDLNGLSGGTRVITVSANQSGPNALSPIVMVFAWEKGRVFGFGDFEFVSYATSGSGGRAEASFRQNPNWNYKVVVGGHDSASTGRYSVSAR